MGQLPFQVVYLVRIAKVLDHLTLKILRVVSEAVARDERQAAKKLALSDVEGHFSTQRHIFSFHGDARVLANVSLSDATIVLIISHLSSNTRRWLF